MKDQKVLRYEKKYYISFSHYISMKAILSSLLVPDTNAGKNGDYFIRSVYFDSLNNDNYYDKVLGIKHRKKLRVRVYDLESEQMKLEIKEKDGDSLMKDTLIVDRCHYNALLKHDYGFLLEDGSDMAMNFYSYLMRNYQRPVITVDYEREAYIHPFSNLRINFDKNIRVNTYDYDLFNPKLTMSPVSVEKLYVLEIKFNDFMPDWLSEILSNIHTTNISYSKYCIGRYL